MVSERLKTLFGRVKKGLSKIKAEDVAKFALEEAVGAIPVVGQIIKDVFDEFSPDEKEELIKELKELSESQFKEIGEVVGVSVEYLKDIQGIALYTFEELRADHEEIIALLRHLIEIKTTEITIPLIQSVLRKGETLEGDFFKKEPEWIDFEESFIVERKEVDEIIKKLENDNIQLVLGEPASGKSVILKNIGFKLANENKDVYVVELKKHSRDEVKRYFDDIPEIKDEKTVFIVDDAHLLTTECERLVREFKNRKLRTKIIIGSREMQEIKGKYPKEASEFEYLSKTDIHAEDVTEEMIKTLLKGKYGFCDERIERVSENLEEYKKDLWHLSWALKAYNPEKKSVEKGEIYGKIKASIRDINIGKDKTEINAEDVFLILSVFYQFEIPIERIFLKEQAGIEENLINQLINLSELIETEEMGKRRTLSLIHSSIADLYVKTYQNYPSLGERVKNIFQGDSDDIEYSVFYLYINLFPMNAITVLKRLNLDLEDTKGGRTLLKKLIAAKEIEKIIRNNFEKEEDIGKIGSGVGVISFLNREVGLKLANLINIDYLASKIEKEEDIGKINGCVGGFSSLNEEVGLKLANLINIDYLASKIEKEEDIEKIGWCVRNIASASKEVGLKLANLINIDYLASKIEKEEDIEKIGRCVRNIASASKEKGLKLANLVNVEYLASKVEKEEDIKKIAQRVTEIVSASKEKGLELINHIFDDLTSKIEKQEDIEKIGGCVRDIASANKETGMKLVNHIFDDLASKIEKQEDIEKIGLCVSGIASANKETGMKLVNHIFDDLASKIEKQEDIEKIGLCVSDIASANKETGMKLVNHIFDDLASKIEKQEDIVKIGGCVRLIGFASKELALKFVNRVTIATLTSEIEKEEDIEKIRSFVSSIGDVSQEVARKIVNRLNPKLREELPSGLWLWWL